MYDYNNFILSNMLSFHTHSPVVMLPRTAADNCWYIISFEPLSLASNFAAVATLNMSLGINYCLVLLQVSIIFFYSTTPTVWTPGGGFWLQDIFFILSLLQWHLLYKKGNKGKEQHK